MPIAGAHWHASSKQAPYPDTDLGCCSSTGQLLLVSLGALLGAINSDDALVEEVLWKATN